MSPVKYLTVFRGIAGIYTFFLQIDKVTLCYQNMVIELFAINS